MKFQIEERKHPNISNYDVEDFRLAKKFAGELQKELGEFLKAVILFGSSARKEKEQSVHERDIDVLLVINDLTLILSQEVIQAYRIITEKTASGISKRLHITTLKLTSFWDYIRNGDPLAVNMLRDGVPLYDSGFFEPLQALLFQGKIKPTKESIWSYFSRAPATLQNADWHLLQATIDLYWAVIDSAHASLMKLGELPTAPSHVAELIDKTIVKKGILNRKYAKTMDFFYKLSKKITRREIQRISGKEYDIYKAMAEDFVRAMKKIVEGKFS